MATLDPATTYDYTAILTGLQNNLDRLATALEGILGEDVKQTGEMASLNVISNSILAELVKHTGHLSGIDVSNNGQWDCCKNGSIRSEALLDATMNNPNASPPEKLAIRDKLLAT